MNTISRRTCVASIVLSMAVLGAMAACGGGGSGTSSAPPPPPAPLPEPNPIPLPGNRASQASPFAVRCGSDSQTGTLFQNAEVEPYLAINPANPSHYIGVWQQDRFSNGGAQGLLTGVSTDGGKTWVSSRAAFSRCTGGNAANGADYVRASDPWVGIAANGTALQVALSFSGTTFSVGSSNAILVSRSRDGGFNWEAPVVLQRDGADAFNDKQALTVDATDASFAYVVWDRLKDDRGPSLFARTTDGGSSWLPAQVIYDPGSNSQTIGNQIVVLPGGNLVNFFTQIDYASNGSVLLTSLNLLRSIDHGATWSAPQRIDELRSIGARDPETGKIVRDGSLLAEAAVAPDGSLHLAWQDARFSGGQRDAIVWSRSSDGGLNWSAAMRVSADDNVQAFTPSIVVSSEGEIGISYFDFRSNTASTASLETDVWLTRSRNALQWTEQRLSGPFNLSTAPDAGGLFLGDYHALKVAGSQFVAFFVQTTGDGTNTTDVFSVNVSKSAVVNSAEKRQPSGSREAAPAMTEAFAEKIRSNVERRVLKPPHLKPSAPRSASR